MMSVYLGFVVEQILKLSKTGHRKKSLYLADPGKKTPQITASIIW